MGAVCGKQGAAAEPKTRKAAVEVSESPPDPKAAQEAPVPASEVCPKTETAAPAAAQDRAQEFITGDGDGVYLLLLHENNMLALVQQYSHSKPSVGEADMLLLQIKPPSYVAIKESRFTLQNGKRTLKMGIAMAMKNADGQKKASIKDGDDGYKTVAATADETSQTNPGTEQTGEEAQNNKTEEGAAKAEAAGPAEGAGGDEAEAEQQKVVAEGNEQQKEANEKEKGEKENEKKPIFQDSPAEVADVAAPKVLEQMQVLRHLCEGRSPNFSSLHFIIVVPLAKAKAEEALKDGWIIDDGNVEKLRKQIDKLNGVMVASAQEKAAQ